MTARSTWRNMKTNSRQRLHRFEGLQLVSPGGKSARLRQNLLGEQRDEQLAVEPRLSAFRILFGKMAQLGNLLKTLEHQFDLPPKSIVLQDQARRKFRLWKGGQHRDILGVDQGLRL